MVISLPMSFQECTTMLQHHLLTDGFKQIILPPMYWLFLFCHISWAFYCGSWMIFSQFSSVQLLSHVWLFATPWMAACQASLSITNSQSLLKLMSIELVMPSSHLILCCPLFLLPPIPPSIRVFSNESTLRMRWPKYWSFSFSRPHYKTLIPVFSQTV